MTSQERNNISSSQERIDISSGSETPHQMTASGKQQSPSHEGAHGLGFCDTRPIGAILGIYNPFKLCSSKHRNNILSILCCLTLLTSCTVLVRNPPSEAHR